MKRSKELLIKNKALKKLIDGIEKLGVAKLDGHQQSLSWCENEIVMKEIYDAIMEFSFKENYVNYRFVAMDKEFAIIGDFYLSIVNPQLSTLKNWSLKLLHDYNNRTFRYASTEILLVQDQIASYEFKLLTGDESVAYALDSAKKKLKRLKAQKVIYEAKKQLLEEVMKGRSTFIPLH